MAAFSKGLIIHRIFIFGALRAAPIVGICGLFNAARAETKHLCWQPRAGSRNGSEKELGEQALVRNSLNFGGAFFDIAKNLQTGVIDVSEDEDNSKLFFSRYNIEPGDCILYNSNERFTIAVRTYAKLRLPSWITWWLGAYGKQDYARQTDSRSVTVVPAVITRTNNERRLYGLVPVKILERFTPLESNEATPDEMVAYAREHAKDFTIIYVFCVPERNLPCELKILRDGKWVGADNNGKKPNGDFTIPVLARSKVTENAKGYFSRIRVGTDTPQGVYPLWAVLQDENPRTGTEPQLSLDFCEAPINSGRIVGADRALLDHIIPLGHSEDYWAQEFALAHAFGRCGIRIHAQNLNPSGDTPQIASGDTAVGTTLGCISAGARMPELLDKLAALGVFERDQYLPQTPPRWRTSSLAGKVFVVVRDQIEKN